MTAVELIVPLESQLGVIQRQGNLNVAITDVTDDSRLVKPGSLFVAVKGGRVDGHAYIRQAVQAGASAVVIQAGLPSAGGTEQGVIPSVPMIRVKDSRRALGLLASRLHQDPSFRLAMIGVTGTNGKTTVTYLCKAVLEAAGRRVGARRGGRRRPHHLEVRGDDPAEAARSGVAAGRDEIVRRVD